MGRLRQHISTEAGRGTRKGKFESRKQKYWYGTKRPKDQEIGDRRWEIEDRDNKKEKNEKYMLMQIPTFAPGQLENWLIPAAAVLALVALVKKVFPRKLSEEEFVTKSELHHELNSIRDKIDARFLALSEKIEAVGSTIHERLTRLESAVARLDERTKR
jgi:hypothetical protein